MAIINSRLPVQVFFQTETISLRRIDKIFTLYVGKKEYRLNWRQVVALLDGMEKKLTSETQERYIKLCTKFFKEKVERSRIFIEQ